LRPRATQIIETAEELRRQQPLEAVGAR
jgi:hypothetical protein